MSGKMNALEIPRNLRFAYVITRSGPVSSGGSGLATGTTISPRNPQIYVVHCALDYVAVATLYWYGREDGYHDRSECQHRMNVSLSLRTWYITVRVTVGY